MMKSPSISALVRVHNGEDHVGETVEAILAQTRRPDEVLVIDDGSTDGTVDVLRRFGSDIRIVSQPNGGHASAFNRGFEEAGCEYVAICDADDIWEPSKLERQCEALLVHPEIDLAFSGATFFGLVSGPRAPYAVDGLLSPPAFNRDLYQANFICTSTTLVRRELYERVGQFREAVAPAEDFDYWLRALEVGAVFFHDPTELVRYRTHAAQASDNQLRMHERELQVHGAHESVIEDPALARSVLANDCSNIGRALSDLDRYPEAKGAFESSLRHRFTLRVLAWVALLSIPRPLGRPIADALVATKRALKSVLGRWISAHPTA
jgi:glycosyltransferase involved in cell wall biosynthesis